MNYGDIVELGRHRLMCGDARKREDIERLLDGESVDLVLTDPPYGMKCQDSRGYCGGHNVLMRGIKQRYRSLIGDDSQDTAREYWQVSSDLTDNHIIWGGQYFAHFLPISGAWIFWDKHTGTNDFSDGELAWCSRGKRIRYYSHLWNGVCRQGSYALNPRPRVHPTQKPVELHAKILEDFSAEGDLILDCFGGSGTTLIACEITGRTCFMMELSPEYCDVIINRYNSLTRNSLMLQ
ncbi:MAG: site-specific DNA-methyltransferase [Synergistaceae bacterium]|nr:site-specific DNA-methyltransferase [Synergistaceae bacterium]